MPLSIEELHARARRVRLVLLDVDGVLTDGTVDIDVAGKESKRFFIRDGLGIVWSRREGIEVGLLSGRPSAATSRRAAELGLSIVVQEGPDKGAAFTRLLGEHGYAPDEVAYMGDDLLDLPVLRRAGVAAAPADSSPEVLASVHWVSQFGGGRGAVRELIELILRVHGRWDAIHQSFLV
ncbi:MAG: HAD-IIIA family hydrolase [Vicinamibacterales bacterium]